MKLENQVCTLEQAKRLQELGVKEESQFCYAINGIMEQLIWGNIDHQGGRYTHWEKHPAYTVAELGEMLPKTIEYTDENEQAMYIQKDRKLHAHLYWIGSANQLEYIKGGGGRFYAATAPTEAQARAITLIYLLENGIIQPAKTTGP